MQIKRIIFLDFDGVLNSELDYERQVEKGISVNELEDISTRCVGLVNNIIAETNADVVVSSVWRNNRTIEQLKSYKNF